MMKWLPVVVISLLFLTLSTTAQKPTGLFSIEKHEISSAYTDYNYQISVFLPDGYQKDVEDYATLYLFLGGDDLFQLASGIAQTHMRQKNMPKTIVVGITNISWWTDLTPQKVKGRKNTGGGPAFYQFVAKQLIPHIDKQYRTNQHRIYAGHSLGGMFGLYALLENRTLFEDFVLVSPSIVRRADILLEQLKSEADNKSTFDNDIYFTVGSKEGERMFVGLERAKASVNKLTGNGLQGEFIIMQGHDHFSLMAPTLESGLKYVVKDNL